jgi:3-phosphoshikimate 1-carboxyvinyltransferase
LHGRAPVKIRGGQILQGMRYNMPMASAQVKSAVLLAGMYAEGATTVVEPAVARDHTERMLLGFGCDVSAVRGTVTLHPPKQLTGCALEVPGDFSSAAFFIVAGCLAARDVFVIRNVGINRTRTGLLDILALMGADIRLTNHRSAGAEPVADIEVRRSELRGISVPAELVPLAIDEFPVLFVAAACAVGETIVTGAEELRVKESDRIGVMAEGLRTLGVDCEALPDGMRLQGRKATDATSPSFAGGQIDSHGDHRIAMSFAVASLRAKSTIEILDVANVATSFPGFVETAAAAGLPVQLEK